MRHYLQRELKAEVPSEGLDYFAFASASGLTQLDLESWYFTSPDCTQSTRGLSFHKVLGCWMLCTLVNKMNWIPECCIIVVTHKSENERQLGTSVWYWGTFNLKNFKVRRKKKSILFEGRWCLLAIYCKQWW